MQSSNVKCIHTVTPTTVGKPDRPAFACVCLFASRQHSVGTKARSPPNMLYNVVLHSTQSKAVSRLLDVRALEEGLLIKNSKNCNTPSCFWRACVIGPQHHRVLGICVGV